MKSRQKADLALKQYSHADSCTNNQTFKTSRQGVGDHGPDRTGREVKSSHFRRPVKSRFKLLFEPHAFMERTDTHTHTHTDRCSIMLQGARMGYRPDSGNNVVRYLAFRNLQAVVGGATSSTFPVTAGVPQGSILGPTLFLIYVNDAPEVLPRGVMPATYADDTTLFSLVANAVDAAEDCNALQAGTDALSTWGTTWRIQFEPTKSQAMTISRHRQPLPIAPLRFGGVAVEEVTTLRLLGVTFDNTMNFGQHLRSVTLRATQRIGFLRKASPVLDPPGRLTAYKGFVRPLMEYCPLVWNGAAPSHLARLDRVQKRALSLIGPGAVVDSLALRRTISGLCVLFKLMCGARLPCMAELLPPPADYANPRTRRQLQAAHGHCFQLKQTLPSRSHNTILQSFPNAHIPIWNSLPSSVLQEAPCLRSLQSFKSKSYKHLLKKDWLWATQAYP